MQSSGIMDFYCKLLWSRWILVYLFLFLKGLVADITGSYVPVFNMVGGITMVGAAILLVVSCIKKPNNLNTKEEMTVLESHSQILIIS